MARKFDEVLWGTELFLNEDIYVKTRTIFLHCDAEGLDTPEATKFIKQIHVLNSLSTEDPITVMMNCVGGSVIDGMAIYDAIQHSAAPIKIIAFGYVCSMATVILQAASNRVLAPNVAFMIHIGSVAYEGHPTDVRNWRKFDEHMSEQIDLIYLKRINERKPKFTVKDLKKILEHDTVLNATQAISMGLADSILGEDDGTTT